MNHEWPKKKKKKKKVLLVTIIVLNLKRNSENIFSLLYIPHFCSSLPCYGVSWKRFSYSVLFPLSAFWCLWLESYHNWKQWCYKKCHLCLQAVTGIYNENSLPRKHQIKTIFLVLDNIFFPLWVCKSMNQNNCDQAAIARGSLQGCFWLSSSLAVGRNGL